jgi:hypothetical protein
MLYKKKIAILFSGQIRENSLGNNIVDDISEDEKEIYLHDILELYEKNFFTNEFRDNIDYDIFIVSDKIDIEKTLNFFGKENVKNIYLTDTNYYLNPIESKLNSTEFYKNRLFEITDSNYIRYPDCIYQYHKMAQCFELLTNYKNIENYDYIMRSRLDTIYTYNIFNYIKELNNDPLCLLFSDDDQFAIGRPNIMKEYFNLINNFGTYHNHHLRNNFNNSITTICNWKYLLIENAQTWRYASLQLMESLFQYCDNNNLDIDTSLKLKKYGYIRRHIRNPLYNSNFIFVKNLLNKTS